LTLGVRGEEELASALLADLATSDPAVLAVHAEVEGGPFAGVLDRVLASLREEGRAIRKLEELPRAGLPERELRMVELPGRSGRVATAARGEDAG
jgi:hypothetical protein